MDFIGIAGVLWNLLIMTLLPMISIIMGIIFIFKIFQAAQVTTGKWFRNLSKGFRR